MFIGMQRDDKSQCFKLWLCLNVSGSLCLSPRMNYATTHGRKSKTV